jgi:hypothetical protein
VILRFFPNKVVESSVLSSGTLLRVFLEALWEVLLGAVGAAAADASSSSFSFFPNNVIPELLLK